MLSCSAVSDSLHPHGLYIACQTPLSMGFSRQEYWSGLLFPTSGHPADPKAEPVSLVSLALAGGFFINFFINHLGSATKVELRSKSTCLLEVS